MALRVLGEQFVLLHGEELRLGVAVGRGGRLQLFGLFQRLGAAGEVVFDLLQGFALGFRQTEIEEDRPHERDAAVHDEGAVSLEHVRQEGVRFDDDEDAGVGHAGRETADDTANLHRVEFADHDPRDHEEAERAGDGEDENARHREPRGDGFDRRDRFLPALLVVEVRAQAKHGEATADSGYERKRSTATPPQQNCRDNGEDESH